MPPPELGCLEAAISKVNILFIQNKYYKINSFSQEMNFLVFSISLNLAPSQLG